MKHLGKNVVIVVALVAAGFLAAWLRFRPYLVGGEYTDGLATYETDDTQTVRYAVWDAPEALRAGSESTSRETRPAVSPDGRWLVFEAGERGLNCELWIAELVDGSPRDPRPLTGVESPYDECAPAFSRTPDGSDELYFASDRPGGAGGLDLWRATFDDGRASAPERLAGAVQSSADDTDPAPRPSGLGAQAASGGLVFASKRGGACFELFEAWPDDTGAWSATRIEALASDSHEREPSFTADGRTLFFASDRGGDFDLWRATRLADGWSEPTRLSGLATPLEERAPCAAFDDFSLYFARGASDGELGLVRARSRELFLRSTEPVGWVELLVLALLLLAALLAWLAKRWPRLETLYKCYLVSLVAHLLLLWLFGRLFVDSSTWPRRAKRDGFQVRLEAPRGPSATSRERAGELEHRERAAAAAFEPARETPELRETGATPLVARFDAPDRAEWAQPNRSPADAARAPAFAPELSVAAPDDAPTRRRGDARELELAAGDPGGERSSAVAEPVHGRAEVAGRLEAPTNVARFDGPAPRAVERPGREALERVAAADAPSADEVELAAPNDAIAKRSGGAERGLGLDELVVDSGARATHDAAPTLGVTAAPGATDAAFGDARPNTSQELELAPRRAEPVSTAQTRAPLDVGPPARASLAFELDAERAPERRAASAEPSTSDEWLEALAPAASSAASERENAVAGHEPERHELAAPVEDRPVAPAPAPLALAAPPPARDELPVPKRELDDTPFKNRSGVEKARALELYGGSRETEAAVAKGLAYLARIQRSRGNWGDERARDAKYGEIAIGKTGLALLAFLGAGHTQSSATEHSAVVARALEFLVAAQDPATGHFGDGEAYGHGIATYALSECYALTGDETLRAPLERAVAHVLANQNRRRDPRLFGGWSYYYADGRVFDRWPRTAITVWQVMALESARLAGLDVPRSVFDDARTFLENARDPREDWYRYSHDPERLNSGWPTLPASTPAALFALALFGEDLASAKYAEPRRFVLERAPREYRRGNDDEFVLLGQGNLYFWYYGTLAMFRTGGESWKRWNAAMKDVLVRGQSADGSWRPIDVYANYAEDDERDKSYTTAMCVLSLEVYYRYYLPLLQVR
ncbi:MAG: hypothetical protein L6Q99_22445 [Planctomycetes bacterium]|nr:hypothetical protein [Planctomycetota bacterium]